MVGARYSFLLRYTLILIDLVIINTGLLIGYVYKYSHGVAFPADYSLLLHIMVFNELWFVAAYFLKLYFKNTINSLESIYRATWKIMIVHAALIGVISIFAYEGTLKVKLAGLATCYGIIAVLFIVSRLLLTYIVEFIINKGNLKKKIAILGYNDNAQRLAAYFSHKKSTYSFEGFFSEKSYGGYYNMPDAGGNILAPVQDCIDYAVKEGINEIYSTLLPNENRLVQEMLVKAENNCVRVRFVTESPANKTDQSAARGFRVINTRREPLEDFLNQAKKRAFDVVFSSFVIVFILSWLIPLVGLLIKLESKGPVFFAQKRSGRDNKVFTCLKFRSMRVTDESDARQASRNDNRITRVGAFLRKTSLDEFPQFLNVFMGCMSIAGPRPHMLAHTEQYRRIIDHYMVRQFLKPGITGWAQVNGCRGETEDPALMQQRVEHDISYMENWSLMFDIRIVFMTVINVLKGEERAY